MAPGHSGFLNEYPLIRVDNFTGTLPRLPAHVDQRAREEDLPSEATHHSHPHLLFLSHPHTDHLNGLSSFSRHSAPIYCSHVTKELLLRLERKKDRERFDDGSLPSKRRPYRHLRRTRQECAALDEQTGTHASSPWDILIPLPFDVPTVVRYTAKVKVRLTLLPANHMPGSAMLMVEGPRGTVLHTGDTRLETTFLQWLMTKTHLGRLGVSLSPTMVLSPDAATPQQTDTKRSEDGVLSESLSSASEYEEVGSPSNWPSSSKLVSIYLDTERVLDNDEPVERAKAIIDVVQLIKLYPSQARFHVDCWTSGYEHFLISASKALGGQRIHIDRYKSELYAVMSLDEDFARLSKVCSTDRQRCGHLCACDDERCKVDVVRIEPRESISASEWHSIRRTLFDQIKKARAGKGSYPESIPLPIQRHSPLPELYRAVETLRPHHIVANTATLSARFMAMQMTRRLNLFGATAAEERNIEDQDGYLNQTEWDNFKTVWSASRERLKPTDSSTYPSDQFFALVKVFRQSLWGQRKRESERMLMECLDACCDSTLADLTTATSSLATPSPSLLQSRPSNDCGTTAAAPTVDKLASTNASPFMTAAMRRNGSVAAPSTSAPTWAAPSGSEAGGASGPIVNVADGGHAEPRLTIELASRYLAYAAMYLGWKIRNPSRYRQDLAWRAIRKVKPALARQTEEALRAQLGWAIPSWGTRAGRENQSTDTVMIEKVPLPQTPTRSPRRAAQSQHPSVSPLDLSRTDLVMQLDQEAESQSAAFAKNAAHTGQHALAVRPTCAPVQLESHSVATLLSDTDLANAVRSMRANVKPLCAHVRGPVAFVSIVQEWKMMLRRSVIRSPFSQRAKNDQRREQTCDRFSDQLNLIGAAAYSRRARELLEWTDVDFGAAWQALNEVHECMKSLHGRKDASFRLPSRARVVLRYLQKARPIAVPS